MAAKKYYGVKQGKIIGAFNSWQACKDSVDGYPGAEYKGFSTLEEVQDYLGEQFCVHFELQEFPENSAKPKKAKALEASKTSKAIEAAPPKELPAEGRLLAYVDGSYDDALKKYAFGCIFILPDGRIYTEYGNGDNAQSLQHRNVTGEMLGAMYAVKFAMLNGFTGLELRYDYQGIEKWVTGEWRARTELTGKYAAAMREWAQSIEIRFTKVAAHTNVYYNELADKMANTGLRMGNGVPKVRRIEDMEEYHGTDAIE